MPSSPDALLATDIEPRRWEPVDLRADEGRATGLFPVRTDGPARWSFEKAFPSEPAAAPEPFAVSPQAGVPAALLIEARKGAQAVGYAEGFARGVAAGRSRAETDADTDRARAEQVAARTKAVVEQALAGVAAAAAQVAARTAVTLADVEQAVLDAAFDIAEALVGATLRHDPERGSLAVARALALVPDTGADVIVALHPADHATVLATGALPGNVQVVPDATLTPGDATACTGSTSVDARIASGVARVREVLAR